MTMSCGGERTKFFDVCAVIEKMFNKAMNGQSSTLVCFYDDVVTALQQLIADPNTVVKDVEIESPDCDGYDREYYISLDDEYELYICPGYGDKAHGYKENKYLFHITDNLFIVDDASVEILDSIATNDTYIVEYAHKEEDADLDKD